MRSKPRLSFSTLSTPKPRDSSWAVAILRRALDLLIADHGSDMGGFPVRVREYPGAAMVLNVGNSAVAFLFEFMPGAFQAVESFKPLFAVLIRP